MNDSKADAHESLVVPAPDEITAPAERYFREYADNIEFVGFVAHLARQADHVRKTAAEALLPGEKDPEKKADFEKTLEDADRVTRELRERFGQLLLENALGRGVDNYLTFIAELMAEVFKTRPETLHSLGEVKAAFVLQYETMTDLLDALAERRVERLAYAGMRDLQSDLKETLGFALFESDDELITAVTIIERRNLIVHSRGVVNRRYLSRVPDPGRDLGERLDLNVDSVFDDLASLSRSAADIDERAAGKWGIERRPQSGRLNRQAEEGNETVS